MLTFTTFKVIYWPQWLYLMWRILSTLERLLGCMITESLCKDQTLTLLQLLIILEMQCFAGCRLKIPKKRSKCINFAKQRRRSKLDEVNRSNIEVHSQSYLKLSLVTCVDAFQCSAPARDLPFSARTLCHRSQPRCKACESTLWRKARWQYISLWW